MVIESSKHRYPSVGLDALAGDWLTATIGYCREIDRAYALSYYLV